MKTLVLDPMPEEFWRVVNQQKVRDHFFSIEDEISNNIEIIIIRTKTILSKEILKKYPNLKLIIRAGSGFDNIDIEETLSRNIKVCTTPNSNALSAFEHTISFILSLIKQHQIGKDLIVNGKWKGDIIPNWEISDLRALIVGVGRIGSQVGSFLQYMGAEVKGVDPYLSEEEWDQRKITKIAYSEGIKWCNLISYHCPLYSQTKHYFSNTVLDDLLYPVWLINTARGGILEENAVLRGLDSGRILGLGIDVFEREPVQYKNYFSRSNIIITPHIGANTLKAKKRLISETLFVWDHFVFKNKIINQIDYRFLQ